MNEFFIVFISFVCELGFDWLTGFFLFFHNKWDDTHVYQERKNIKNTLKNQQNTVTLKKVAKLTFLYLNKNLSGILYNNTITIKRKI